MENKETLFYLATKEFCILDYNNNINKDSERCYPIRAFVLASHSKLKQSLSLVSQNIGDDPVNWFYGYLSDFSDNKFNEHFARLKTNPLLLILITDKQVEDEFNVIYNNIKPEFKI